MITVDEFIAYVMDPAGRLNIRGASPGQSAPVADDDSFDFFPDEPDDAESAPEAFGATKSFGKYLLELLYGSAEQDWPLFNGDAGLLPTLNVEGLKALLPGQAQVWDRHTVGAGPEYVVLIEFPAEFSARQLFAKAGPLFRQLGKTERVEDALDRVAQTVLDGVKSRSATKGGKAIIVHPKRVLCVVSICDDRCTDKSLRLVSFATLNEQTEGLETFQLHEEVRTWEASLARENLQALYHRAFAKLAVTDWQQAFTTSAEREQAGKLLLACTKPNPTEKDIQDSVLDMLDTIAKGFGLRKPANSDRRLQAFPLPADHEIGIDADDRRNLFDGKNPFGGVTLRDERSRLLGYIVYPLKDKADADRLGKYLAANNRFHNVLVVYPDQTQASLELWQGKEQLTGRLRKDQGYKDAADVVNLLSRFFVVSKSKVRNPAELAQELAYRARYLRRLALVQLDEEKEKGPLRALYQDFTKVLVGDLKEAEFADAFAQTLTYSLLTARWVMAAQGDAHADRFTRKAAMQHLSVGSRFLSEMFNAVLAMNLEDLRARLLWLVDDIADLLDRIDVVAVFEGDGTNAGADPVIHFYEPFLQAYDAKIRIQRGAFYTPQPVVSYIVRSVHELLQSEFGLADGLADTTTWGQMIKLHPELKLPVVTSEKGDELPIPESEPFVQILDPATGTGTFLVEVIEVMFRTMTAKWVAQGLSEEQRGAAWNEYVPAHLLPRLHAYELMMAPYAIAHMKIGLKLAETGYRFAKEERARIFLTNALEPCVSQLPLIGFDALAHEATAVNEIKRRKRFTVVIGNPPYAGHSVNNHIPAIVERVHDYKAGLPELDRPGQGKWLQDDYVKFIRLGEHILSLVPSGILGYITNHSFLDNPTFKGMRRHLLCSFSRISLADLHGNSKKRERAENGTVDENVFDIQQGVAIMLARRGPLGHNIVTHSITGTRSKKHSWLETHSTSTVGTPIHPASPMYLFRAQDDTLLAEYSRGIPLPELMAQNGEPAPGFVTTQDEFAISWDALEAARKVEQLLATSSEIEARSKFTLCSQNQWNYTRAKAALRDGAWQKQVVEVLYRPFDWRWTVWNPNVAVHRRERVMRHMLGRVNLGIICTRQTKDQWGVLATRSAAAHKTCGAYDINYLFPLHLLDESDELNLSYQDSRTNLAPTVLSRLGAKLGVGLESQSYLPMGLTPENIFDYIYAVFHSPGYRSRYAEFLKIDFPRLPLPGNLELFRALAALGGELTALHLLESPKLVQSVGEFIGGRDREVEKVSHSNATVWLNKAQTTGFHPVPENVWNFHIGGYQVCKKWLDDRRKAGRTLSQDDIAHYQKIITAITETIRIMAEIDEVIEAHGGWPAAFLTTGTPGTIPSAADTDAGGGDN